MYSELKRYRLRSRVLSSIYTGITSRLEAQPPRPRIKVPRNDTHRRQRAALGKIVNKMRYELTD